MGAVCLDGNSIVGEVDLCPVVRHVTFFQKTHQAKLPAAGQPLFPLIPSGEGPACGLMSVSDVGRLPSKGSHLEVGQAQQPLHPPGLRAPHSQATGPDAVFKGATMGRREEACKNGLPPGDETNENNLPFGVDSHSRGVPARLLPVQPGLRGADGRLGVPFHGYSLAGLCSALK